MVLLPSAKQGQFQNMPSDVQCFQKAKSTAQPYWSEFSFKSLCGQASPCSTTSSAVVFCRQTSRQACQPNGSLLCTPLCRHYGWLTEYQNSHSNFKCSAQNFLHDLTPGFSCGELVSAIFVSSSVSLTLFQLPSLVKARVCSYAKHPGRASASPTQLPIVHAGATWASSLAMSRVTAHTYDHIYNSAASKIFLSGRIRLLPCLCYIICLKCYTFHFSLPPQSCLKAGLWGCSSIIRGPTLSIPLQYPSNS